MDRINRYLPTPSRTTNNYCSRFILCAINTSTLDHNKCVRLTVSNDKTTDQAHLIGFRVRVCGCESGNRVVIDDYDLSFVSVKILLTVLWRRGCGDGAGVLFDALLTRRNSLMLENKLNGFTLYYRFTPWICLATMAPARWCLHSGWQRTSNANDNDYA